MARRNKRPVPCPPDVRRVRDQFEEWRRRKRGRERIPERLWRSAVGLCQAGEHGPYRIARWLRLNDAALRDRVRRTARRPRGKRTRSKQRFVEMTPPASTAIGTAEYVVEVDGIRVRARGAAVQDVAALARALAQPRERR